MDRENREQTEAAAGRYARSRRKPRERGIAIIISAILLMFTVGIVGLAIDGGVAYFVKGRLMAAVDSAALGAGRGLNLGDTIAEAETQAGLSAQRFFKANFPDNFMGTDPAKTSIVPEFQMIMSNGAPTGVLQVTVTGEVTAPTYFMKIFSKDNMVVRASGTATRRTLVMMLILDVSGSMSARQTTVGTIPSTVTATSRPCDAMVYAAARFIKYFSPYDYVGFSTFSSSSRVVYPPSTNFKNGGSSGMEDALADVNCSGGTNTAPALNISYDQIINVGLKLAMNSIVLFTDGMPNQVTGNWPLRTQIDTRYGPGPTYSVTSPPTDNRLLYRDLRNPMTTCRDNTMAMITCPSLPLPYSSAQNTARTTHGVTTPLFGDSRFLPLTTAQYNWYNTWYGALSTAAREAQGWYLAAAAGPYRPRWIQDNNAPSENYDRCRDQNQYWGVTNRGVTWMCYQLPLPVTTGSAGTTMRGTFSQAGTYKNSSQAAADQISYHQWFGDKSNSWGKPTDTINTTGFPSGFPTPTGTNGGRRSAAQTFAFIPNNDAMGNSNRGFRDNWVYNVNEGCAPAGTPIPANSGLCRFRGGTWTDYPTSGLGTNVWTAGPYINNLRTDLPNAYPAAAMNSAVSAANMIKNNTDYNIKIDSIYLIGNEDTVDREFLQVIANTKEIKPTIFDGVGAMPYTNPYYNPSQQTGLWYSTTDPTALSALFAEIASSLLRISR
jgi:hypothetical protein